MSERDARAADLFDRVWPAGMPAGDRLVFDAVPPEGRDRVLDRLEAVWRAERGEPLGPLAASAGLKRAAFFNLRRSWREHSLAGLIPHETRRGRGLSLADEVMRARAADLLRDAPGGTRNVEIAHRLLETIEAGDGDPMLQGRNGLLTRLQQAERIVQHERRALSLDSGFLRGAYGDGLLIDFTAIGVVLGPEDPTLAVAAIVMETASTLVLGSSLGRADDGVGLEATALEDARRLLVDREADRPATDGRRCDLAITLPPGAVAESAALEDLRAAVRDLEAVKAGGHAFGQRAVQLVGPRIGRMVLFPRRALTPDIEDVRRTRRFRELALDDARALWAREVARHNEPLIAALEGAGLFGNGAAAERGRMVATIGATLDFLRSGVDQPSA